MSSQDPPTPPNPVATAAAQTGTNVSTAVANSMLSAQNQNTPEGNLRYDVTGNFEWKVPQYRADLQHPEADGNAIAVAAEPGHQDAAGRCQTEPSRHRQQPVVGITGILGQEMNFGGAPGAGNAQGILGAPQALTSFDPGWGITRSYGAGDFSADRQHVEDALMQRMNPQLAIERSNVEQRLADQGIRYGWQAYSIGDGRL